VRGIAGVASWPASRHPRNGGFHSDDRDWSCRLTIIVLGQPGPADLLMFPIPGALLSHLENERDPYRLDVHADADFLDANEEDWVDAWLYGIGM